MKKTKKPTKRSASSHHLVVYVEDSSPSTKVFNTESAARKFVTDYQQKYPSPNEGYWVDLLITDIKGKVVYYDWTGTE